jgi:hypothetical protein
MPAWLPRRMSSDPTVERNEYRLVLWRHFGAPVESLRCTLTSRKAWEPPAEVAPATEFHTDRKVTLETIEGRKMLARARTAISAPTQAPFSALPRRP